MTRLGAMAAIEPREIDGVKWYPLQAVCGALKCDARKASLLVPGAHKRRVIVVPRDHRFKRRICLLDCQGVECLVLRYGGRAPRADLMAALQ